jgi:glycosyltransferase involved in cell wall biosynthesis
MLHTCVVAAEFAGEPRALAEMLALAGHRVAVLVTQEGASPVRTERAVAAGGFADIRVIGCPAIGAPLAGHPIVARAYRAWHWCKGRSFDAICFAECGGIGYFIAAARRLGVDFAGTALIACCEGPTLWRLAGNGKLPVREHLAADHLERASVAWADAAVSRTRGLLEWMKAEAWTLPPATTIVPPPSAAATPDRILEPVPVRELVFVGPLEHRFGMVTFAEALARVPEPIRTGLHVTFLGSAAADEDGRNPREWLRAIMPAGPTWRIADDFQTAHPYEFLSAPGRLAVAPADTEQLPAAVAAYLSRGLPFVACDTPETRQLVHPDDRAHALCLPHPLALASALAAAVAQGARVPRGTARSHAAEETWQKVIGDAVERRSRVVLTPVLSSPAVRSSSTMTPEVTVVLTHRNRPRLLGQALEGLRRQTFADFEVVLVDDGSDTSEALATLAALEPEFARRGWRIIRQSNRYLGAARNVGWRASRGRLVLFHDDDNISTPRQLERLTDAARYSGAAVITSAFAFFEGVEPPREQTPGLDRTVLPFAGGALVLGFFENCFGDAQALIRRDVLESLGGFSEDFGLGHEDWEFFARAALAGHEVLSLPEPLFWYRVTSQSMLRAHPDLEPDLRRSARAYTDLLPPVLRPMLLAALAFRLRLEAAEKRAAGEHLRRLEVEARLEQALSELAERTTAPPATSSQASSRASTTGPPSLNLPARSRA